MKKFVEKLRQQLDKEAGLEKIPGTGQGKYGTALYPSVQDDAIVLIGDGEPQGVLRRETDGWRAEECMDGDIFQHGSFYTQKEAEDLLTEIVLFEQNILDARSNVAGQALQMRAGAEIANTK